MIQCPPAGNRTQNDRGRHKRKVRQNKLSNFSDLMISLVSHREVQVEILFDILEDIDPKLKALGIVEVHGIMTHTALGY